MRPHFRRTKRAPRLTAIALALAGLAGTSTAQELFGSQAPLPFSPAGEHTLFLHESTVPLGELHVTGGEPGESYQIVESPMGPGLLEETDTGWIAQHDLGHVVDYTWNGAIGRYEFAVAGTGVTGFVVSGDVLIVPYGPQDPQGEGPKFTVGVRPGGGGQRPGIDIGAIWPPWLNPYIPNADFYQFSCMTITVLRKNPGGGPPLEEPIPPGTSIGTSGNGGTCATPGQIAQGAGTEVADGSTVYVDSGTGGTPGYRASGGSGTAPPGGCSMHDAPGGDLLPQLGGVLAGMNDPLSIIGIRIDIDFTTYLVVDGMVIWVQTWTWSRTEYIDPLDPTNPPNPTPQGSINLGPAGPMPDFTGTHAAALQDYVDGGFSGAPVQ